MLKKYPNTYQKLKQKLKPRNFGTQDKLQIRTLKKPNLTHNLDQPFCTKSETDLQEKPR